MLFRVFLVICCRSIMFSSSRTGTKILSFASSIETNAAPCNAFILSALDFETFNPKAISFVMLLPQMGIISDPQNVPS